MKRIVLKKIAPLWKVFWILAAVTVSASILLTSIIYNAEVRDEYQNLKHLNALVKKGVESRLYSQESVLKVLSNRLLELDALNNPEHGQWLMDSLKKNSPHLVGFGLAKPNGELALVSGLKRDKFPNILDNNDSISSFNKALKSDHMVLGHAYYMELFDKWVLPLRYSLRDTSNNVQMVMILWYDIEKGNALFSHKNIPEKTTVAVISSDFYLLDYKVAVRNSAYYSTPLPKNVTSQFDLNLLAQNGMINKSYIDRDDIKRYISVTYIPEYELYISLTRSINDVVQNFMPVAVFLIIGTLFFIFLLYLFFNYVAKQDKNAKKILEDRANHDDLTGLINRFALTYRIKSFINKNKQFSLAFIDLDSFKKINDFHGHDLGDKVLKKLSIRIKLILEEDMYFARFSGDEFALLIPGDKKTAARFCQRILEIIKQPLDFEYNSISLTASIGIVLFPDDATVLKTLMSYTDLAVHKAKNTKDCFEFFDQDFHQKIQRKITIEEIFSTALENNEFYLNYQPQVDASSHKIVGIEALVRWESKQLGALYPNEFIPIAEESGFIIPLGFYILKRACNEVLKIWDESSVDFKLSVNVSVRQLMEADFIRTVNKVIHETNFPHDRLVIEVTESLMIEDIDIIVQKLQLLRDLGIGISLDDFGTGFSSLSMINKLPISELKVDQSFVRDILIDKDDALLTEMIIGIGMRLGVEIVAEGVEEKEHVEILEKFGCNILQGYYFSKPVSFESIIDYIKEQK